MLPCALALLAITADDPAELDAWLADANLSPLPLAFHRLVNAFHIDHAVIARPSRCLVHLMPHGSPAAVEALTAALEATGAQHFPPAQLGPVSLYPAAASPRQALAMALLSIAASPLAADILARQAAMPASPTPTLAEQDALYLHRLIVPPTVAIVGGANIGKSTLLNALARRRAAIVADEPGTTRDHLGVSLILDHLAIRWLDTPGLRPLHPASSAADAAESAARTIASRAIAEADLILLAADHDSPFPDWPAPPANPNPSPAVLSIRLRCDLSGLSSAASPAAESPATALRVALPAPPAPPVGLPELAIAIRQTLLPDAWLARASHQPIALEAFACRFGFAQPQDSR